MHPDMEKAKILFFSADPNSAPPHGSTPRLRLDEEVRRIREKVRASEHRDALEFDYRLAARPDDLLQALNEVRPDVVHFSGHGWSEGLILMDPDGRGPHGVDVALLTELFRIFRGRIRVVVLNACLTHAQAEAIADVVGCGIGMRAEISDPAAIDFGAAFYRAIGFGHSVQAAFDQGCLALPSAERDLPRLVARPDVNPAELYLLPAGAADTGERRATERLVDGDPDAELRSKRARRIAVGLTLVGMVAVVAKLSGLGAGKENAACAWAGEPRPIMAPAGSSTAGTSGAMSALDRAKVDYAAGRHAEAFPRFRKLAESGHLEAKGYVGVMFLRGQGTPAHADSGIHWLRSAAYDRDPHAMTELGSAYEEGIRVKHNLTGARDWYRKAAEEKGWPEAMRKLGALEQSEQDHTAALAWFQKAAKAGSLDARIDVGRLYEHGQGTPRDPKMALCLYRTAAEAGSVAGMLLMGRAYRNGIGVSQDDDEAAKWYRKAAEAGSPEGMSALGELYRHGVGVRRDSAKAALWFGKARDAESAERAAPEATGPVVQR